MPPWQGRDRCMPHTPEASLFVKEPNLELVGSFETGFMESDDNKVAWPLPNVIGIRPR